MTRRRRIFLITVSITIGTILSAFLMFMRKKELTPNDWGILFINTLIALAVVVGVGMILRKKLPSSEEKDNSKKP